MHAFLPTDRRRKTYGAAPLPAFHARPVSGTEAGFDEVYVSQIGTDQAGFVEFFNEGLRHRFDV